MLKFPTNVWVVVSIALSFRIGCTLAEFPPVPLIDLSSWTTTNTDSQTSNSLLEQERLKVVQQIHEACKTVGFFQVSNHGIPEAIMDNAWAAAGGFFDLPLDEKLSFMTTNQAEYPYGYEQSEQLSKGKELDGGGVTTSTGDADVDDTNVMDSKETFAIGPNDPQSGMPLRRWQPTPSVPTFQSALEEYYEAMNQLANILFQVFALALDKPIDYFVNETDHHMSALRLLHYYPLNDKVDGASSETIAQGKSTSPQYIVRAGAHTDYGALTILNTKRSGLQVLRHDPENRTRTEWFSMPVVPGALNINLGDLMQRWTNGMYCFFLSFFGG